MWVRSWPTQAESPLCLSANCRKWILPWAGCGYQCNFSRKVSLFHFHLPPYCYRAQSRAYSSQHSREVWVAAVLQGSNQQHGLQGMHATHAGPKAPSPFHVALQNSEFWDVLPSGSFFILSLSQTEPNSPVSPASTLSGPTCSREQSSRKWIH